PEILGCCQNALGSSRPSESGPTLSLMPYSATIARAICVAFSRSFWAPVATSPKTTSSATRPPIATPSMSLSPRSVAMHRAARGVEHVRTVGRGRDDDALGRVEPVHLHEELVEGLLALVVGPEARAHDAGAPLADRVDLIEEHEGRGLLLRLLEQLPNPGRAE